MKVFLSWSGEKSHHLAKGFKEWLEVTLQSTESWLSSSDIESGTLWFQTIFQALRDTNVGIVFLTPDTLSSPWILFESGALAKGLEANKICTILIDLKPGDVEGPLAHFNHTTLHKDQIFKLLTTLNKNMEKQLNDSALERIFNQTWPILEKTIAENKKIPSSSEPIRNIDDKIDEILLNTRDILKKSDQVSIAKQYYRLDENLGHLPVDIQNLSQNLEKSLTSLRNLDLGHWKPSRSEPVQIGHSNFRDISNHDDESR